MQASLKSIELSRIRDSDSLPDPSRNQFRHKGPFGLNGNVPSIRIKVLFDGTPDLFNGFVLNGDRGLLDGHKTGSCSQRGESGRTSAPRSLREGTTGVLLDVEDGVNRLGECRLEDLSTEKKEKTLGW